MQEENNDYHSSNDNKQLVKEENSSDVSTTPPLHGDYDQELTPRATSVTMSSLRSSPTHSMSSGGGGGCGRFDSGSPNHHHMPSLLGGELHACSNCSATFPTRDLLEKHELMHSPNSSVVSTIYSKFTFLLKQKMRN